MSYKSDIEFSLLDILNEDKIMITFDKRKQKFVFYDSRQLILGSFTVNQLIKYIGTTIDQKFMEDTCSGLSVDIIESFVVKINRYDATITLINQQVSPFMGNIEMLLNLYTQTSNSRVNNIKIMRVINEFNYVLAQHILQIMGLIMPKISNDETRKTVRDSLMYYSAIIIRNINAYVMNEVQLQMGKLDALQENLYKLTVIKTALNEKIDSLAAHIAQIPVMGGGGAIADNNADDISSTSDIVDEIFNVEIKPPVFDSENKFDTDYTQVGGTIDYISDNSEIIETDIENGGIFNVP